MLVQIGKRAEAQDVVELLLECHDRIRKFLAMARGLAQAAAAAPDEIRDVAWQVRRYFLESLPLHIADEEDDIVPRLAGASAEIDHALAAMEADHASHEPLVHRLVELCGVLIADPRQVADIAAELGAVASRLTADFAAHLEVEERVIFAALRQIPSAGRGEILAAMRARRQRVLG